MWSRLHALAPRCWHQAPSTQRPASTQSLHGATLRARERHDRPLFVAHGDLWAVPIHPSLAAVPRWSTPPPHRRRAAPQLGEAVRASLRYRWRRLRRASWKARAPPPATRPSRLPAHARGTPCRGARGETLSSSTVTVGSPRVHIPMSARPGHRHVPHASRVQVRLSRIPTACPDAMAAPPLPMRTAPPGTPPPLAHRSCRSAFHVEHATDVAPAMPWPHARP